MISGCNCRPNIQWCPCPHGPDTAPAGILQAGLPIPRGWPQLQLWGQFYNIPNSLHCFNKIWGSLSNRCLLYWIFFLSNTFHWVYQILNCLPSSSWHSQQHIIHCGQTIIDHFVLKDKPHSEKPVTTVIEGNTVEVNLKNQMDCFPYMWMMYLISWTSNLSVC